MRVEADDNAQVLLDFGEGRFASVTTGFTMQQYRSPAIELYGSEGTIQLLGDDWAPEGWELWRNDEGAWRVFPESDPHWQWTEGLRHLVDCVESGRPTITRPEHAFHALEIMLAAQAAGRDGVAREIESGFPDPSTARNGSPPRPTATPTTAAATMGYKPSPRPSFDAPTVLRADEVVRHTWGDPEAGFVEDWIYVSSQLIHAIVFGMPPGGRFTHSESFRTIFAADELLYVLQGTLVLANPETGEIVRAEPGESVFFRRDTWHHGFSYGDEPLRVLEFFAPPPATGTSGAYALHAAVPRGEHLRRRRRARTPRAAAESSGAARSAVLRPEDAVLRLDRGVLVGLLVSTEHLTVGTLTVAAGRGERRRGRTRERSSSTPRAARCASRRAASRRRSRPATAS